MLIEELLVAEKHDKTFVQGYQMEKAKLASAVSLYLAREEAGLTQVELAEMAGTTQATIARIERGDNVSFEKLSQLAHAMDKQLRVEFI